MATRTLLLLFAFLYSIVLFGQNEIIDVAKLQSCEIKLDIHFADKKKDYECAKPLEGKNLILITLDKKNRIKDKKEGQLKTKILDGEPFTYFVYNKDPDKATFFSFKDIRCYDAACYYENNK